MLIANGVSSQFKAKFLFYEEAVDFLNKYKLNLSFKKEKMKNFLENLNYKTDFQKFVDWQKESLENSSDTTFNIKVITSEEKEYLIEMLKSIGQGDTLTEITNLNMHLENVMAKLHESEICMKKYCPLIIKLSFLFGLAIAILLI